MKKHAISILAVLVIAIPGLLNAQSACVMDGQSGYTPILAVNGGVNGGQQLTQQQADCALELIDFMAAAVKGVDLIRVDEPMLQIWRSYVANNYALLTPGDREFLGNAPTMFYNLNTVWPRMTPAAQNQYRQTWANLLPPVLQFIEPVVTAARQQQLWQMANAAADYQSAAPLSAAPLSAAPQTSDPYAAYQRQQQTASSLATFNARMSVNTIDLMHSMSQMGGH